MFVRLKRVPNIPGCNYAGKRWTGLNSIYIREKHARNGKVQCNTAQARGWKGSRQSGEIYNGHTIKVGDM